MCTKHTHVWELPAELYIAENLRSKNQEDWNGIAHTEYKKPVDTMVFAL
jgi:hypothetical protein